MIEVKNLTKKYGGRTAVDDIGFNVKPGEIVGFLGPNGAGKTTAVKLLNGMLSPTGGTCRVFDVDPYVKPEQVHQFSGVITEHAQMYGNLTGLQNLIFFGALFGISAAESNNRAIDLLNKLGLTDAKDRKLATYSTGMRQRLSLARAMIHRPKILFLDEPTSGLDPESALSANRMIKNLAETEGTTVFLCTHQLRYAQEICCSYGLIDNGALLAVGNIDELRSLVSSGMTVSVEADRLPDNMTSTKIGERNYEINVQSESDIPQIVKRIVDSGGSVYHVSSRKPSLEDIYFLLLKKSERNVEAKND